MRRFITILALTALCLCPAGCNDDDPVTPGAFSVRLQVVDTEGDPVEGLRVGLVNDTPYFQDGRAANKASAGIQFTVPKVARVRIAIRDVEGVEIRLLVDDQLAAGSHRVIWNGLDKNQDHQHSGRYTVHMAGYELGSNTLLFEDTTDMYMALLDSSRVPTGYTDADGKLVLKDKKLFPHLYDLPAMTARDENGDLMGKLDLTSTMRISLLDENGGGSMRFKEEIVNGTVLNLAWDPAPPKKIQGTVETILLEPGPPPPVVVFKLNPVFPNPFN